MSLFGIDFAAGEVAGRRDSGADGGSGAGAAFEAGAAAGLVQLATAELQTTLPATLSYLRDLARDYLTRLCHTPGIDRPGAIDRIAPPAVEALAFLALQAPPMKGLEYLNADVLRRWWVELDEHVRRRIAEYVGGAQAYLREKNPLWRLVGRVTFHLAENKRDESHPFAFMATYASRLSAQGRVQHLPLARALEEYAGAKDRAALVSLLTPIHQAAERIAWVKELLVLADTALQSTVNHPQQGDDDVVELQALCQRGPAPRQSGTGNQTVRAALLESAAGHARGIGRRFSLNSSTESRKCQSGGTGCSQPVLRLGPQ